MRTLQDILYKVPLLEVRGDTSIEIEDFFFDSREVNKGCLFVAVSGTQADGHRFIPQAVKSGAMAVVCEIFPEELPEHLTFVRVKDSSLALSFIAANFYENPAEELKVIGITGTNGKTTTATLLYEVFMKMGVPSGLFSTVVIKNRDKIIPATHTTPDPKTLHRTFSEMLGDGCEYCFMEVSSHSIVQNRVASIPFVGGVFTNITHDHLDYHKTFGDYLNAKKGLFDMLGSQAFALVNVDDRNGAVMLQNTKAKKYTYGLRKMAEFKARILDNSFIGLLLVIDEEEVLFRMIGSFNAYNLLAVYGVGRLLGFEKEQLLLVLSSIQGVAGRFQQVNLKEAPFRAVVDYAHTPDALKNVLKTLQDVNDTQGRIITVVGCGGNRDKEKRPIMAKIATELSDLVILTSDNPRFEEPAAIISEMQAGVPVSQRRKVMSVENRREAIAVALRIAQDHDVILVAGKGHENYQDVKGVKSPFDDAQVLIETYQTIT